MYYRPLSFNENRNIFMLINKTIQTIVCFKVCKFAKGIIKSYFKREILFEISTSSTLHSPFGAAV